LREDELTGANPWVEVATKVTKAIEETMRAILYGVVLRFFTKCDKLNIVSLWLFLGRSKNEL
jgi:hypothetical protein